MPIIWLLPVPRFVYAALCMRFHTLQLHLSPPAPTLRLLLIPDQGPPLDIHFPQRRAHAPSETAPFLAPTANRNQQVFTLIAAALLRGSEGSPLVPRDLGAAPGWSHLKPTAVESTVRNLLAENLLVRTTIEQGTNRGTYRLRPSLTFELAEPANLRDLQEWLKLPEISGQALPPQQPDEFPTEERLRALPVWLTEAFRAQLTFATSEGLKRAPAPVQHEIRRLYSRFTQALAPILGSRLRIDGRDFAIRLDQDLLTSARLRVVASSYLDILKSWDCRAGRDYWRAHLPLLERGIRIRRVFILDATTLSDTSALGKILRIMREQRKAGVDVWVAENIEAPFLLKDVLLVDDSVVSQSEAPDGNVSSVLVSWRKEDALAAANDFDEVFRLAVALPTYVRSRSHVRSGTQQAVPSVVRPPPDARAGAPIRPEPPRRRKLRPTQKGT